MEFAKSLPSSNLLWNTITKLTAGKSAQVNTDDLFRLLVGINFIDVPDMYSEKNEARPTSIDYVLRSNERKELLFWLAKLNGYSPW